MKILKSIFSALLLSACLTGFAESGERMPVYITPWYNSEPFTINVGELSNSLKSNDPNKIKDTAEKIKKELDTTPIEAIYVLAIRLYDLGEKDEAVYWYYTAQFRKNIYANMIENASGIGNPAFELKQGQHSFNYLSGRWINGYAGGIPEKWTEIISKVAEEGKESGYIGKAYPSLTFKPEEEQKDVVNKISDDFMKLRQYISDNLDELAKSRKESGIEGKY